MGEPQEDSQTANSGFKYIRFRYIVKSESDIFRRQRLWRAQSGDFHLAPGRTGSRSVLLKRRDQGVIAV